MGEVGRENPVVLRVVPRPSRWPVLTRRELIVGTLFISTRTVEMHVGSAFVKLDCRTRAQAAQLVASLGLLA